MRYIPILILAFVLFACAERPNTVDAAAAYEQWLVAHPDGDNAEPVDFDADSDEPSEVEDVTDDHEIIGDPDTLEKDLDLPDEDLIDEDMVDEDLIITPMTCNTDTCNDPGSGLTWQRDASYTGAQANSASFCSGIGGFGGFANWRLPTIAELKTLRRDCDSGCVDAAVCYWDVSLNGNCDKKHWSSTLAGGSQYYTINFKTGAMSAVEETVDQYARCVTDTTK